MFLLHLGSPIPMDPHSHGQEGLVFSDALQTLIQHSHVCQVMNMQFEILKWGLETTVYQPDLLSREVFCLPGIWIGDIVERLPKLVQTYDCYLLLFFHVGTNDSARGNLESIKTDYRVLEVILRDMGAQVLFLILQGRGGTSTTLVPAGGTTLWDISQSRRFLESTNDEFLTQVTEEPMRRGALLALTLTKKEGLIEDAKAEGILGCRDHEMVHFRILRGGSRAKSEVTTLDVRRADFSLFKDLLGRVLDTVRKAKTYLELKLARDTKGSKKGFYEYISGKGKTRENVDPLLNGARAMVTQHVKKARVLNAFFASVFY
ncbi:hypothetical protein QYF61_025647 [Mycteria americana]|uniref:Uncharacterized protein n=1 Tax=Mycteria americana TaxID=33587 RepID=A0AAN7PFH7_MYCAM|nr:hypothetical protein QYF61_025647 [Mycteria americana]